MHAAGLPTSTHRSSSPLITAVRGTPTMFPKGTSRVFARSNRLTDTKSSNRKERKKKKTHPRQTPGCRAPPSLPAHSQKGCCCPLAAHQVRQQSRAQPTVVGSSMALCVDFRSGGGQSNFFLPTRPTLIRPDESYPPWCSAVGGDERQSIDQGRSTGVRMPTCEQRIELPWWLVGCIGSGWVASVCQTVVIGIAFEPPVRSSQRIAGLDLKGVSTVLDPGVGSGPPLFDSEKGFEYAIGLK